MRIQRFIQHLPLSNVKEIRPCSNIYLITVACSLLLLALYVR